MLSSSINFVYWYIGEDSEECAFNFLFNVYALHV